MESNKETTINDIYRMYLDGYTDRFLIEYDNFKKKNSSLFTDFLDMFIKYNFPCKNIIKNCLDNADINTSNFLIYLLSEFIDFYKPLDEVKDISEENNFSYINFFISNIITDKNDTIENYQYIKNNTNNIDKYYEEYVEALFKDFREFCIDCINTKNMNNNKIITNSNIKYYTKIFDFISMNQRNNAIYNNMYHILKKLFFEFKKNEVVFILDNYINNYIEKKEIQNDIIRLLRNESLNGGYEYFNFITNCFGEKINSNDYNFRILFLDLLDKDKLVSFITNKNKYYNLKCIFKNEIIINNEKIKNVINDYKEIGKLKKNLSPFTTREYIEKQIDKYKRELDNKSKFIYYTNNKKYNYNFGKILDRIDKNIYPIIYEVYKNLLQSLEKPYTNYSGNFGFVVIDGKEYLFVNHNDEITEELLYNSNLIKKIEYDKILKYNNYSDMIKSEKKDKERDIILSERNKNISLNSDKNSDIINNKNNETIITFKSEDNVLKKPLFEEKNEYHLSYYKGFEFETNSSFLFKNLFSLDELPCYFFYVGNNEKEYKDYISFNDYNKDLFGLFVEADGAFINQSNEILEPQLDKNYYPFLVQKTFIVSTKTVSKKKKFILNSINEGMLIGPKSIIIVESKLSIPKDKDIDIDYFNFSQKYNKSKLDSTMIFTLNKLIKKKKIYSEYVQKEVLKNKEEINNYKFEFFLLYDNIPVKDVDEIIERDLQKLIDNDYINDKIKLKVIYLMPNIGSFNLTTIKNDIKKLQEENKNLKNTMDKLLIEVKQLNDKLNNKI